MKNKNELKKLYSELCKYVHASHEELQQISHSKIIFTYDRELFDKCYIFTNKVMDTIIFILMSSEKRMIKKIQEDKLMILFLKETHCELSLKLLNKI